MNEQVVQRDEKRKIKTYQAQADHQKTGKRGGGSCCHHFVSPLISAQRNSGGGV